MKRRSILRDHPEIHCGAAPCVCAELFESRSDEAATAAGDDALYALSVTKSEGMAREALFETPVGYEFYRNAVYYAADPAGPGTLAQRLEVLRYVLGAKGACPRRLFVCYLVSLHGRTIRQHPIDEAETTAVFEALAQGECNCGGCWSRSTRYHLDTCMRLVPALKPRGWIARTRRRIERLRALSPRNSPRGSPRNSPRNLRLTFRDAHRLAS